MRKKLIAVAMATTLIVTSIIPARFTLAALDPNYALNELQVSTAAKTKQKLTNNSLENSMYSEEDEVTIIVELNDESLLDRYNSNSGISTYQANEYSTNVNTYLESDNALQANTSMIAMQDAVIKDIQKLDRTRMSNHEVLYHYTTVMNGFAMKAKYGELASIKEMPNVKNAYVARTYQIINPDMTTSTDMINAPVAYDNNYKGQGMVVAVLDTGLDTSHEAFNQAIVENAKITQDKIAEAKNSSNPVQDGKYVNDKVPFAYDYADKDNEVTPSSESVEEFGNDHGTHVSGIVAGNSSVIQGVAPEAQLVFMKVFSDYSNGASTENILAGLEDAVKLGVDAINMSLGSANGYSTGEEEGVQEVYDKIVTAGINLAVSAGNSYSSSFYNEAGGAFTTNPDTSVVGSPSTYTASTSVASCINTMYYANYIKLGDNQITYSETAAASQPTLTGLVTEGSEVEKEYVIVPNIGDVTDYNGIDVNGKIAVVKRGGITFNDKVVNAASGGAIAVVVANNQPGTINMSIQDYTIPAVSVTQADGAKLQEAEVKKITIKKDLGHFDASDAKLMSDFSSWGVTPDLKLKPEITAPGENIYSSLPFNNAYGSMSGTSMAAPHIAGIFALVRQYIEDTSKDAVRGGKAELANQLLMSTAVPIKNEDGVLYSPRKQGSGLVNVGNAITTPAYAYVDDASINYRPKLDLLDSQDGVYEADFVVQSVTGSAITYNLKATTLTDSADEAGYILEKSKDISDMIDVTYSGDCVGENKVTITNPYGSAQVHVKITLKDSAKEYFANNFANGEFVEGFIFLETEDGDSSLSLPFMGYYGDWTQAPIMDASSIYDNYFYGTGDNEVYQQTNSFLISTEGKYLLGVNPYDEMAYSLIGNGYSVYDYPSYYYKYMLKLDPNKIAISPNGDGVYDDLYASKLSLLRNARILTSTITDANGEVVYSNSTDYAIKSSYYNNNIYPTYDELNWTPAKIVNNEQFTYTVSGVLDYNKTQNNLKSSMSFPVTVDIETPTIKNLKIVKEDGKVYATFEVSDNQYVAYVGLSDMSDTTLENYDATEDETIAADQLLNESVKATTTEVKLELTDYTNKTKDNFKIYVCDYAGNEKSFTCTQSGMIVGETTDGSSTGSQIENPTTPTPPDNEKHETTVEVTANGTTTITADTLKAGLADKNTKEITVIVEVANADNKVVLSKEAIKAIAASEKNLVVVLKDDKKNVVATWEFDWKEMQSSMKKLTDIDLNVQSEVMKDTAGLSINFAQKTPFFVAGKLTISLDGITGVTKGSKVYIYHVNNTTGKYETIVGGYSQYLDNSNMVTIPVVSGDKYVVLAQKASAKDIVALKDQIQVKAKKTTIKKGKTTSISVSLPSCLEMTTKLDTELSFAKGAVVVDYKSSDKSVATVDKQGKITAKKKGTVVVTATITLYNGKKKVVKMKVKVS